MPIVEPKPPYLSLPESAVKNQRVFLQEQFGLLADKNGYLCIVEQVAQQQVSLSQYAQLIQGLLSEFDCQIILTAGPGESENP